MEIDERHRLLTAWVAYWRSAKRSAGREQNDRANEAFYDLSSKSPELCIELCEDLLAYELENEALAVLAAGPLEGALASHGPTIIDQVETRARRNPKFRHLLGGVWKNRMANGIWERVCKARGGAW